MKILFASLSALAVLAAQSTTNQPKFEVASVKRTDRCFAGSNSIDPGAVTLKGVPLKAVLKEAFKVQMDRIEGPSWLDTDCFDIAAKIPEGATGDQVPAMLQALLAERFRLTAHKQDRPQSGYALLVDKGGPTFKEDHPQSKFMRGAAGKLLTFFFPASSHGGVKGIITMATLAANLSREGYGPVEDATGLTGKYEIDVTWVRDPAPRAPETSPSAAPGADASAPEAPSMFAALRDSLGLKLERRHVQVQFVVIDRIERIPTEN